MIAALPISLPALSFTHLRRLRHVQGSTSTGVLPIELTQIHRPHIPKARWACGRLQRQTSHHLTQPPYSMGKPGLSGFPRQTSHYLTRTPILHGKAGRTEDSHAIHHATPHQLTVLILHRQKIPMLDNYTSTHTNSHTPWARWVHEDSNARHHTTSHQLTVLILHAQRITPALALHGQAGPMEGSPR